MAGKKVAPIRPDSFPLGSIESRMAMRTLVQAERTDLNKFTMKDLGGLSREELDFALCVCILNIARNHGPERNTSVIKRETIMQIEDGANIWYELERTVLEHEPNRPEEKCAVSSCLCRPGREGGGSHIRVIPAPLLKAVEVDEAKKELKPIYC